MRREVPASVVAGDALLHDLARMRAAFVLPLARAAAALAAHEGWRAYGYATRSDFARERLCRDGRWLSDLVRLHQTIERLPALASAVCGEDGDRPLGTVAALQIARVATPETVGAWITRARQVSLEVLRGAIAEHLATRENTRTMPAVPAAADAAAGGESGPSATEVESGLQPDVHGPAPDAPRVRFLCTLPADVKLVFEALLELYRNVAGREASPAEFVQALTGEAASVAWTPPEDFQPRLRSRPKTGTDASWGLLPGANRGIRVCEMRTPATTAGAAPRVGSADSQSGTARDARVRALYSPAMRQALLRIQEFGQLRARLARLEHRLPPSGARRRIRDLRRLVRVLVALRRLEDRIEIDMADLLLEMHEHRAWTALGYAGLEAYAEERLGMGGSTARKRVGLARQLRSLEVVRQAYATGKLGVEAAQYSEAVLRHQRPDQALQALWVEHAHTTTIKRLRSERRLHEREHLSALIAIAQSMTEDRRETQPTGPYGTVANEAGVGSSPPAKGAPGELDTTARRSPVPQGAGPEVPGRNELASDPEAPGPSDLASDSVVPDPSEPASAPAPTPIDDAIWRGSLRLVPGETRVRAIGLGYELLDRVVRDGPLMNVPLRIDLPAEVATEFLGCVEAARRKLTACSDDSLSPSDDSRLRPAARIAREFTRRRHRVPEWVGLLALLEEWVLTNDEPEVESNRRTRRVLERDGYRCMAPGCTARARLQVHHIDHRARGGGNELENLITLCLFHHMQGEHGGLARVRGQAPLDVVWRLGATGLGTWFRNERRLAARR